MENVLSAAELEQLRLLWSARNPAAVKSMPTTSNNSLGKRMKCFKMNCMMWIPYYMNITQEEVTWKMQRKTAVF
jgi:hypothetical protein